MHRDTKDLFTPNDSATVTVTLTSGTLDLFDGHCDGENSLHSHFGRQRNICYDDGDRIAWRERAFKVCLHVPSRSPSNGPSPLTQ